MLKKSMILNLEIGKKDFSNALKCTVVFGVFGLMTAKILIGIIILLIGILANAYFIFKGLNEIFYKSLFEEKGQFYMGLPVSERDLVVGKIIAATLWAELVGLVELAFLVVGFLLLNLQGFDFLHSLVRPYLESGMTPMGVGFFMALIPLELLIAQIFIYATICFCILWNKLSKPLSLGPLLSMVPLLAYLAFILFTRYSDASLYEFFRNMGLQPYAVAGLFAAAALLGSGLFIYLSTWILKKKYNY